MKNKKLWGRLMAVAMCSAMLFTSTVSYAAELEQPVQQEQTVEQTETEEVVAEEETDTTTTEEVADTEQTTEEAETTEKIDDKTKETAVENRMPSLVEANVVYDGTQNIVFKFDKGAGDYELANITELDICDHEPSTVAYSQRPGVDFTYDLEKGELIIRKEWLNQFDLKNYCDENGEKDNQFWVAFLGTLQNGEEYVYEAEGSEWNIEAIEKTVNSERPQLTAKTIEFDGTQDLVFNFKNGTSNHKIKEITDVNFYVSKNVIEGDHLTNFNWGSESAKIPQDLEKGEITIPKSRASAVIYGLQWNGVGNTYRGQITYLAEDGNEYAVDGEWYIKVLERSADATPQYIMELPKGETSIDKDIMEELVDINKTQDVIIRTPNGIVYSFAKDTMKMIDGKETYDLGAELIEDFSKVPNAPFTEEEFAFRINYNYSGQLPAEAKISIPVDRKWNGKTLYYYEILANGEYKYTSEGVVDNNGIYTIKQNHCSDYVATTKKLHATDSGVVPPNTDETPNSDVPKTGDTSSALPYMMLGLGACGVLVLRRKFI